MSNSALLKWIGVMLIGLGALLVLLFGEVRGESLIVVGFDGVPKHSIDSLLAQGQLPGIQKVLNRREENGICPLFIEGFTLTVPSWTTFFTGMSFDQTGVIGNNNFATLLPNIENGSIFEQDPNHLVFRGVSFWLNQIPTNYTIFHGFKQKGYEVFVNSSKAYLSKDEQKCPFAKALAESATAVQVREPKDFGDAYLDELTTTALNQIKKSQAEGKDFFLFLHLDPDYYAHHFGGSSRQFRDEIVRCDRALDTVFRQARKETTRFLVLSDHGFESGEKTHLNSEDAWFVTDLPIHSDYWNNPRAVARMRDLTATLIDYFQIEQEGGVPRIRGKSMLLKN